MSSYPKIEQLFDSIIEDCYNYLLYKINLSNKLIDILKNPFKYHKKDINIDNIYSAVYTKIQEIKTDNKYVENEKKFNALKNMKNISLNIKLIARLKKKKKT